MRWDLNKNPDVAQSCLRGSAASREAGAAQPEGSKAFRRDAQAQPSEPILFPKLRIYFADFPYLLYSIDQRLLTLET